MILPNMHNRMLGADTGESLLGMLRKKGVGITVNQTIAELFQRILYDKNLSSVIEIERPGPISEDFLTQWFYTDRQLSQGGRMIRIHDNPIATAIRPDHLEGTEHRVDEFVDMWTLTE